MTSWEFQGSVFMKSFMFNYRVFKYIFSTCSRIFLAANLVSACIFSCHLQTGCEIRSNTALNCHAQWIVVMCSQGAAGDEGSYRAKYTAAILCVDDSVYLLFLPRSWERWAHNMDVKVGETECATNGEQVNKTCRAELGFSGKAMRLQTKPRFTFRF